MSEVKCLREFAHGVIGYRSRLQDTVEQAQIIAKWNSIEQYLDRILSEPGRFRTWSDRTDIELYQYVYNKGQMFRIDKLSEGMCMDLPQPIKDRAMSINTHGKCIILYYKSKCRGHFRVITTDTGYHENLLKLGFSRGPRSIKSCDFESSMKPLDKIMLGIEFVIQDFFGELILKHRDFIELLFKVNHNNADILSILREQIESNISKDCLEFLVSENNICYDTIEDDNEFVLQLNRNIRIYHEHRNNSTVLKLLKINEQHHCCLAWSFIECFRNVNLSCANLGMIENVFENLSSKLANSECLAHDSNDKCDSDLDNDVDVEDELYIPKPDGKTTTSQNKLNIKPTLIFEDDFDVWNESNWKNGCPSGQYNKDCENRNGSLVVVSGALVIRPIRKKTEISISTSIMSAPIHFKKNTKIVIEIRASLPFDKDLNSEFEIWKKKRSFSGKHANKGWCASSLKKQGMGLYSSMSSPDKAIGEDFKTTPDFTEFVIYRLEIDNRYRHKDNIWPCSISSSWSINGSLNEHEINRRFLRLNNYDTVYFSGTYRLLISLNDKREKPKKNNVISKLSCESIIIDYIRVYDVTNSDYPDESYVKERGTKASEICQRLNWIERNKSNNDNAEPRSSSTIIFIALAIFLMILIVSLAISIAYLCKQKNVFDKVKHDNLYCDNLEIENELNYQLNITVNDYEPINYEEVQIDNEYLEIY